MNASTSQTDQTELTAAMADTADEVERALAAILDARARPGEIARPERLMAAMRHGALNGGKRLRPFLLIQTAGLFGVAAADALTAACALECVHCYSLVHDDLPAMDDDDLRRGKPTVHRQFDEASAILAGDSLLTLAFDLLADPAAHADPAVRAGLVSLLARAAGCGGMAGGQALDLDAEHRALDAEAIAMMQAMKTGALIRFACEAGGVLGGATKAQQAALGDYGAAIGRAFQLADDLLDVTATTQALGKSAGKDGDRGKATLVAVLGIEEAKRRAETLCGEAIAALAPFGDDAAMLNALARFVVDREF